MVATGHVHQHRAGRMRAIAMCLRPAVSILVTSVAPACQQIVPLPFSEEQQQQQEQGGTAVCPMHHVVMAAQAAAVAAALQPFAVKQLPYRAYAVVLNPRYIQEFQCVSALYVPGDNADGRRDFCCPCRLIQGPVMDPPAREFSRAWL